MKEINGIIREDVIVTESDGVLKLGSELRFEGGVIRYIGSGVLNVYGGDVSVVEDTVNDGITYGEGGTNIVAGDYQIFYGNAFSFKGKWNIKGVAYASWFGLVWSEGVNCNNYDNSVPINTAIKLKGQGEVRLPIGKYGISHHISVPAGIQLIGAGPDIEGLYVDINNDETTDVIVERMGTVLFPYYAEQLSSYELILSKANSSNGKVKLSEIPFPLATEHYNNESDDLRTVETGYMIVVNIADEVEVSVIKDDNGVATGVGYVYNKIARSTRPSITRISGIDLVYEESRKKESILEHHYRGILFEGKIEIDNVRSFGLVQFCSNAGRNYSDNRYIHDNSFSLGESRTYKVDFPLNRKLYAFDLRGLGDALNFRGNHDSSYHNKIGSLQIDSCYGGVIEGNILNSDIMINQCCGVTFNGNHCEYGIKLDVRGSSVSICDNIFWKGEHPTIRIRRVQYPKTNNRQVVTLRNNTFYNFMRVGALKISHNINSTCDYDVVTDGCANIVIENCFRTRFYDNVNEFEPTGINIGLLNVIEEIIMENGVDKGYFYDVNSVTPIKEFNNNSHLNSVSSVVCGSSVYSNMDSVSSEFGSILSVDEMAIKMIDEDSDNPKPSLTYYYENKGGCVTYNIYELYDVERKIGVHLGNCSVTLASDKSVINIHLSDNYNNKHENRMLFIVRTYNSKRESMLVPLCGATSLTDCNEGGINGYKWVSAQVLSLFYTPSSFVRKGRNVECEGSSLPNSGTWVDGDVVWYMGVGMLTRNEYRGGKWYRTPLTVVS